MKITTQPQFSLAPQTVKTINPIQSDYHNQVNPLSARCGRWFKFAVASLVLAACFLCAAPLRAQTATFKSVPNCITVPLQFNGTVLLVSNLVTVRTNGSYFDGTGTNWVINPVSFSVSGAPSGVTATVEALDGNPVGAWQPRINTNGASSSSNLIVRLVFNGNEAEGVSIPSLNVSGGVVNNILLKLQVGSFWTAASTNATYNWSSDASWALGVKPAFPTNDVIFGSDSAPNAPPTSLTNSIVDQNFTIGSLRFAQTNTTAKYHTLQINPNVTLTLVGSNGLSLLKDSLNLHTGNGGQTVTFTGGGTLVVSNEQANITVYGGDNSAANLLDLSQLGTFVTDVNQIGVGDARLYPYYRNLNDQNAYNGQPRSALTSFNMAQTNVVKAVFADPNNYTNADSRLYSLSLMYSELSGSSTAPNFYLGISNIFNVDSVDFIGGNSRATVKFNSSLLVTTNAGPAYVTNSMIAVFRGTNGGRMSVFTISDGGGTNTANSNLKATIDFSLGTLDMLCDRFYIARDRKLIVAAGTPAYQGNFTMGNGIVDANTVVLGFREYNQTNTTPTTGGFGSTEGSVTIVSNGVFKVNNSLTLGSTVNTNAYALIYASNNREYGQVTVVNGGTLIASNVLVGGPVYGASLNNFIIVSNASTLILSNMMAGPNQYLDNLNIANGSTMQVQIDGNHVGPYIYVTNMYFSSSVGNNILRVASIQNLTSTTVPLIYHVNGSPGSLPTVVVPAGFVGGLQDNGANNTIDLMLFSGSPKNLLWRGTNPNWDTTTKNWYDQNTGLMTNFTDFDVVAFDDAGGYPTTIIPTEAVFPGAVHMTNNSIYYTFGSGTGQIQGSGVLTKVGTGTLEIDGSAIISYVITQGVLTNSASGTCGGVTVSAGAAFGNAGKVRQGGITCAGQALNDVSGTVNGPLTVQSGGVVTNLNIIQHGALTVLGGGFLYNGLNALLDDFGSGVISSNATLFNDGWFGSDSTIETLAVGGKLIDTGASGQPTMELHMLTVNPGGVFIPGGDGIGTSEVRKALVDPDTGTLYPARVLLSAGSTNIFKVNPALSGPGVASTLFQSGYQDYGPSQGTIVQNGCTIVITNINSIAAPFAAGQYFTLFENSANSGNPRTTGASTNAFPVIIPAQPGSGLAWDLRYLWGFGGSSTWGIIGIIPVALHPTNVFVSITPSNGFVTITSYTTNTTTQVITTNFATNNVIFSDVKWPQDHTGWRLQQQANPSTIGLSNNWADVFWARYTNDIGFTNNVDTNTTKNSTYFFRMVSP